MKLCRCPLKGNEGQRAIHGAVWNPSDFKIMERGVYISRPTSLRSHGIHRWTSERSERPNMTKPRHVLIIGRGRCPGPPRRMGESSCISKASGVSKRLRGVRILTVYRSGTLVGVDSECAYLQSNWPSKSSSLRNAF